MKRVLDPLAQVPGLRRALLISKDGVPITHIEVKESSAQGESGQWSDTSEDLSAFAGMTTGLMAQIYRSVDTLTWDAPQRVVMRAARGTLIMLSTERVTLAVELERGMAPEELRIPMESAIDRLRRSLARGSSSTEASSKVEEPEEPPGPLPGDVDEPEEPTGKSASAGTESPKTTTES